MFRKLDHVLDVFLCKQRHAGSDPPHDRNTAIGMAARSRRNGERSRLKSLFLEMPLPFQRRDVVLNCGWINSEAPPNLANGWRKTVGVHKFVDEVQNRLLSFGEHEVLYTEQVYGSQARYNDC